MALFAGIVPRVPGLALSKVMLISTFVEIKIITVSLRVSVGRVS